MVIFIACTVRQSDAICFRTTNVSKLVTDFPDKPLEKTVTQK